MTQSPKRKLPILDTDKLSTGYRRKAVMLDTHQILVTNFRGSQQANDLTEPPNCGGLGRVRHFRRDDGDSGWPSNPLPIDPAAHHLRLDSSSLIRAQVFQNAVCNWRCWYCFVDFDLLSANPKHSEWITAEELVERYLAEASRPPMIDLTGGQPDLTPEWVIWMMDALERRGVADEVYLWSDDNLSNDYFWRYLSEGQRERIASYQHYGRVCCFKGYHTESFSFNTCAAPELFEQQFELAKRLVHQGIDLYAYVTLTSTDVTNVRTDMARFMDRLQAVDRSLPLRTVPLEIRVFTPVKDRMDAKKSLAIENQAVAVEAWLDEIGRRFSPVERSVPIYDVPVGRKRRQS